MNDSTTIHDLRMEVVSFANEREWAQFHDPKNLVMALASEIGELSALMRWIRSDQADGFVSQPGNRTKFEQELGDVAILLILLSDRLSIPLDGAVRKKLAINAERYPKEQSRGRAERPDV